MEFIYKAKDIHNQYHQGSIESSDLHSATAVLRKKGLIVISLQSREPATSKFLGKFLNRVSFTELVIITRQLATMVSSGLVLSDAIDILEEQQINKVLKKVLGGISQDIKGGLTLAHALSKYPDIFPHLFVNLVKAGEASGQLDKVLLQMADGLEKDREFKAKVQGAMIYPILVMGMMVVVMIIMMVFVIPKLISLYQQSTIELPLPTKILIGVSNIFVQYWWLGLILLVSATVGIIKWKKTPEGSLVIDRFILKMPIVGQIVTNVTLTNFNRTFGLLTSAGIPILESIGILSDLMDNTLYKNALKEAYRGVEKGLPFSSLLGANIFPRIVGQMVKVGEETGKVDEIFFKLADYFETESDHMLKNLTVAIEPIILIILGIGVAFLVISIILPIYKLTTSF
ncbi:type II secretion system F family protein [Candidatus Daviesbacteria bacterium]|nr:type II secretion system F family protein [Candidatus Daviesbacteria bacterium]